MSRVFDVSPANQVTGGSKFKFKKGRGRIVDLYVTTDTIPAFSSTQCALNVVLQPLDTNWQPTADEPITDTQLIGDTLYCDPQTGEEKYGYHPGIAAGRDDATPTFRGHGDLGGEDPRADDPSAELLRGNCLLSLNGKAARTDSAFSLFLRSLVNAGVKPSLTHNFYTPDLTGMEAEFTQLTTGKSKGKGQDITVLVVGRGEKEGGADCVHKYPNGMTGAASGAQQQQQPRSQPRTGEGPQAPNGAPAPPAAVESAEDISALASGLFEQVINECEDGQQIPRGRKILARLTTKWLNNPVYGDIPPKTQAAIKALFANDAWFSKQAAANQCTATGTHDSGTLTVGK